MRAYLQQVETREGEVLAVGPTEAELQEANRERVAQAAEAERLRNRGRQWRYYSSQSQMMDFTNHFLTVEPQAPVRDRFNRELNVILRIRCMENTTALVLTADEYLGLDNISVQWRIDDGSTFRTNPSIATNREAFGLWRGGESIPFIQRLLREDAEYLTVRYTPYGENARTMRFHVHGLDTRITPLREACGW